MNILDELFLELDKIAQSRGLSKVDIIKMLYKNLSDFLGETKDIKLEEVIKTPEQISTAERNKIFYNELIQEFFKKENVFLPERIDGSWLRSRERKIIKKVTIDYNNK